MHLSQHRSALKIMHRLKPHGCAKNPFAEAGSPRCTLQLIHAFLCALQPAINFQNSPFKTKTMNLARTHSIIGYHDRLPDRAANLAEQIHRVLNYLSAQAPGNLKQANSNLCFKHSVPMYAE